MELRQLIPEPADVEVVALLSSLDLKGRARPGRPYTLVNFISSADGRATFRGRSGALGDPADKAIFNGLREKVDAVLVGTGTLRVERYGRLIGDPERRRRRVAAGLEPEPLTVIVTRMGELPDEVPLFDEPESPVVVFSPVDLDLSHRRARIEVVRLDPAELTLVTVLRRLRADHLVASLLCEGGPTMFAALLGEGLVDELFLTLAPKLTGGGMGPTITSGPELPELRELELLWALNHGSGLYLRYRLD